MCQTSSKTNECRLFAVGKAALQGYSAYRTCRLGLETAKEAKDCFKLHRNQTECLIGLESAAMSLALFYTTYRLGRMVWKNAKIAWGKSESKIQKNERAL